MDGIGYYRFLGQDKARQALFPGRFRRKIIRFLLDPIGLFAFLFVEESNRRSCVKCWKTCANS